MADRNVNLQTGQTSYFYFSGRTGIEPSFCHFIYKFHRLARVYSHETLNSWFLPDRSYTVLKAEGNSIYALSADLIQIARFSEDGKYLRTDFYPFNYSRVYKNNYRNLCSNPVIPYANNSIRIDLNIQSEEVLKRFEEQFNLVHNNFIRKLTEKYPDLNISERKMCAYLKMNLTSKEIAPLLNLSLRGVETLRYRLRKKLGLGQEDNLMDYLNQFV